MARSGVICGSATASGLHRPDLLDHLVGSRPVWIKWALPYSGFASQQLLHEASCSKGGQGRCSSVGIPASGNLASRCPSPLFDQVGQISWWYQAVQPNGEVGEAIDPVWCACTPELLHEIVGKVIAVPLEDMISCALVAIPSHVLNDPLNIGLREVGRPGCQRLPVNVVLFLCTDTSSRFPGHG